MLHAAQQGKKRLYFFGLFCRGKAKKLQGMESRYYENVKIRLLQPNQKFTLREQDRSQRYCLNFSVGFVGFFSVVTESSKM